ncbi:MAG: CRISPR-associated endonuclease Cas2 [Lachnospiraceae bacterium]|nr:CRISPR-associated endonuclease Cas2 [Lachnospiraceae bacterium]
MRVLVFFDLPTVTDKDKREYRRFRKMLIQNGFVMMQESVYTRMVLNKTVEKSVVDTLKRNKPSDGLVQAIVITEKQFAGMVNISGEFVSNVIDTDERLVIL